MKKTLILLLVLLSAGLANAQKVGIKTNLLYDAAANANLGLEFGLAPRWTLDISADYNAWPIKGHKWKHWLVQPEARYWFCEPFVKSFIGVHAIGGEFNVGNIPHAVKFLGSNFRPLRDHRYDGWAVGGGVAYGYALPVSKHFNMEFEIGVGYVYVEYDKFSCADCSHKLGEGHHHYFGPTKAAINLVYLF